DGHVRPLRLISIPCLTRPGARTMVLGDRIIPLTLSLFLDPFHPAHVVTQHLRYRNAPIRLLIVFENGHQRAADGQSGSVEGMNKLCFCAFRPDCALNQNPARPRLKSFKVAAGGNLPIMVLGRKPDFDVVSLCRGEAHIAGTESDDSVMKS